MKYRLGGECGERLINQFQDQVEGQLKSQLLLDLGSRLLNQLWFQLGSTTKYEVRYHLEGCRHE